MRFKKIKRNPYLEMAPETTENGYINAIEQVEMEWELLKAVVSNPNVNHLDLDHEDLLQYVNSLTTHFLHDWSILVIPEGDK